MITALQIFNLVCTIIASVLTSFEVLKPFKGMTHRTFDLTFDGSGKVGPTTEFSRWDKSRRRALIASFLLAVASAIAQAILLISSQNSTKSSNKSKAISEPYSALSESANLDKNQYSRNSNSKKKNADLTIAVPIFCPAASRIIHFGLKWASAFKNVEQGAKSK